MAIDKSKYIIHDVPRVYGVLPVSLLLSGAKWSHLKSDLPELFSDYKLIKVSDISAISTLPLRDIHNYFMLRGEEFWTQIIDLINDCIAAPNPDCGVWGIELYLEADVAILNELVPVGIHNSEKFDENGDSLGQKTFAEWNDGGDQPIAVSNDDSRCLIRTNISGVAVSQEEILIFDQFKTDNPGLNITMLNSLQLQSLMGTAAYQTDLI